MAIITRYHDFSAGHRVMLGAGACARLHGHNYRVTFHVQAPIDATGHAIEFGEIKSRLCQWLEDQWDHRFLIHIDDPMGQLFRTAISHHKAMEEGEEGGASDVAAQQLRESIVYTPFHPTTENIAEHLLRIVGPAQLKGTGARLIKVEVSETRKCGAIVSLSEAETASTIYDPRQGML